MTCQKMRSFPLEYVGGIKSYCFDVAPYREESGLSVAEGRFEARSALKTWPETPTAAQRRALAAAFIASGEADSALVQWFRLDSAERIEDGGLGPKSVALLNSRSLRLNESSSVAARLAARMGLERVFYVDEHILFLDGKAEDEAYWKRVGALWPGDKQRGLSTCPNELRFQAHHE